MNRNYKIWIFVMSLLWSVACSSQADKQVGKESTQQLPANLVEENITLGDKDSLSGKITYAKGLKEPAPAVILVHGSGPLDKDSTVGKTKLFEDLAYGLAKQGIVVIRYDKRTYTYGKQISTSAKFAEFTYQEETIDDVLLAKQRLLQSANVDAEKIYVLGHSMGAMLAPEIDRQSSFAGLILLAGTPRSMIDVLISQNQDWLVQHATEKQKSQIEQSIRLLEKVKTMDEQTAKELDLGSMRGYYLLSFESLHSLEQLSMLEKPVLILQGEEDFQVKVDTDYALYVEALSNKTNIQFRLYPKLNHVFMESGGEHQYTIAEYDEERHIEKEVVDDIARFILQH